MDRRSFFVSIGAAAAAPVIGGCTGRDGASIGGSKPSESLLDLRAFVVPEGVEAALPFAPLRKQPRK